MTSGKLPKDGYLLGDMELRGIIEAFAEDNAIFQAVSVPTSAGLIRQHGVSGKAPKHFAQISCNSPTMAAQQSSLHQDCAPAYEGIPCIWALQEGQQRA